MTRLFFTLVCLGLFFTDVTYAESYSYPELQVVPKASSRLASEAKDEDKNAWTTHIPVQVSALTTIAAGIIAGQDEFEEKDGDDKSADQEALDGASQVAIGIGSTWIAATVIMSATYRPYSSCLRNLPKRSKSQKAQLARERAAEECLHAPAKVGRRIALLSATTNVLAGGFIAATANNDLTAAMGGIAAVAAFAPYMFSYHWQDVEGYHEDYKKRIYGPVTELRLIPSPTGKLAPALSMTIPI